MKRAHQPDARDPGDAARRVRVLSAAVTPPALSRLLLVTAAGTDARLGAPRYRPWMLTGLQGARAVVRGERGGGGDGSSEPPVQLPWIAYAVVTGQLGFIPACAFSAVVQARSFAAGQSPARRQRERDGVQVYV